MVEDIKDSVLTLTIDVTVSSYLLGSISQLVALPLWHLSFEVLKSFGGLVRGSLHVNMPGEQHKGLCHFNTLWP